MCIFILASYITPEFRTGLSLSDVFGGNNYLTPSLIYLILLPFIWNIWKSLYLQDYYTSSHIKNLDYFILYLRSFDDDRKKRKNERKVMKMLYTFFCPFAVGKPNELQSYAGSAPRIYLRENWKIKIAVMMRKAPIILLRVNNTDNFFWEFEHCFLNNYLDKSLLWITDTKKYKLFRDRVLREYNYSLPIIEDVSENCLIYKEHDTFTICKLDSDLSYLDFRNKYDTARGLSNKYLDYFCGRNQNYFQKFFTWKRNPLIHKGIQEWSWPAFIFPEYYILFQRFPNRNLTIILFIFLFFLWIPLRIPLMIYMGRNGKKIIWLNEKWESTSYFEKIHLINSIKTISFGTIIVIILIILYHNLLMELLK